MLTLAAAISTQGLLGILFYCAILAVVVWGVIALIRWSGIPIPEPVRIVLFCVVAIVLIIFLFRAFGILV